MPASLLLFLIFDLNASRARAFHHANCTRNVKGTTPAGIDINKNGQGGDIGHAPQIDQHVFHSCDPEIRDPARSSRHATARQIQCLKSARFCQQSMTCIDRSNALQR
jgi:hypothetical protein